MRQKDAVCSSTLSFYTQAISYNKLQTVKKSTNKSATETAAA